MKCRNSAKLSNIMFNWKSYTVAVKMQVRVIEIGQSGVKILTPAPSSGRSEIWCHFWEQEGCAMEYVV